MRVCMVAYTFYEGDNRVRRYAETLVRRGYTVDAIVLRQNGSKPLLNVSGVNVYKIQKRSIDEKRKVDYLLKLLLFLFKSAFTLSRLHLKKRYDLVHVHSVPDFEVFAALIPKLTGAKVILDIHDIVPELFASKFKASYDSMVFKSLVLMEKLSMLFSDHVIVANHIWYKRLIERSVPAKKCTVVMNHPDPYIFVQGKKQCQKPNTEKKFTMMYPGTLSIHQGLETAIRAVDLLRDTIPQLQFQIYGKGTDEQYFRDLIGELNLENRVFINEVVAIEKLPQVISGADIGVEPKLKRSFGNEAFSTKILEFMLMGIPVIASDTLVHTHYFTQNQILFFRSEDHRDLADRILTLKRNRNLRGKMIENSLNYMKNNNWETRKHIYHSLVDTVVKEGV
ncbi:glycosyltransferase family 4 protein [Chitinispirillales bacterium ANBcel5]|uniref:glycosyltransferase family 4 protein n=1 Tax=Cellulosispirillum alkaliphilum TaxID=3039283 RepID=UPI002A52FADA|nr:glycosyltransferase family 4 protein [Chitinispirillales bacterium ANBcel5]